MGFIYDKCDEGDPTIAASIVTSIVGVLNPSLDLTPYQNEQIPNQIVQHMLAVLGAPGTNFLSWQLTGTPTLETVFKILDEDTDVPAGAGNGDANSTIIHRLKEGAERFMISNINDPGSGNLGQSEIFVMFDLISANAADFNHVPGGANVLYMDGHVNFVRYPSDKAPVIRAVAMALGLVNVAS